MFSPLLFPVELGLAEQRLVARNQRHIIGCDFCGAKYDDARKFVAGLVRYTCEKCIDPAFKGSLCRFGSPSSDNFVCSACEFQNDGKRRFVPEKVSFICDECVSLATKLLASRT